MRNARTQKLAHVLALAVAGTSGQVLAEQPRPADSLVDSIGVNIHAKHDWGPYNDWTNIKSVINDLGIRYVRDIPDDYQKLNDLSAATGVKVMVIVQDGETTDHSIDMNLLPIVMQRTRSVNNIYALEGPNERDNFYYMDWQTPLMEWQTATYQQAKADPLLQDKPFVGPSIGPWGPTVLPQLYDVLDAGNFHHYPQGTVNWELEPKMWRASHRSGEKPIYMTEVGYHNAMLLGGAVSELAGAKYMAQGFFDLMAAGIKQSYVYELAQEIDDANMSNVEAQLGMVRMDFSYKPVATATKNLITLMKDPGADFTPADLDYTLTGGDANLKHMLFQKRDGDFMLALWQDVTLFDGDTKTDINVPSQSVQLSFANAITGADTYLPVQSAAAQTHHSGMLSQLNLNVPGELLLVRIDGTPTWKLDAPGDWNDSANWFKPAPNGINAIANLGSAIAAPRTITSNAPTTLGRLRIDNASTYTLTGTSSLTFQTSATNARLDIMRGSHVIDLPTTFASSANIAAVTGAALSFTKPVTINAGKTVTQSGSISYNSTLTIQSNAKLALAPGQSQVLQFATIDLSAAGSKIDIADNRISTTLSAGTFTAGSYTGVAGLVKTGHLTSSMPDFATGITALAVKTLGASGSEVIYTYNGDANLSGRVDADDYFVIDSHYAKSGTLFGFTNGDFNYDGKINGDDYMLIDYAFSSQGAPIVTAPAALSAVPEPSACALLSIMAAYAMRRRRRA